MKICSWLRTLLVVCVFNTVQVAHATYGSRFTGYGTASTAMGGASVALPLDALAAVNNPAGMSEVGNRLDLNALIVLAQSDVDVGSRQNRHEGNISALVPGFGINYQLTPRITVGLSTAATGASIKLDGPVAPGIKPAKGELQQLDLLPTITYKFDCGLSLGVSFVYAVQKFDAQGIPAPVPGGQFPDHNTESAYGTSWRVGGLWKANDKLNLGVSYSPKMKMSKLAGYKDDVLSLSGGSIDSPEQYSLGAAYVLSDKWTVALDYQHIAWDKVDAYSENFGWRSQEAVKLGVAYKVDDLWTIRAGIGHARRHITSNYAANNFLLVGINSTAYTFGVTRKIDAKSEVSAVFEYDYGKPLKGTGASEGSRIDSDFYVIGVGYGWRF